MFLAKNNNRFACVAEPLFLLSEDPFWAATDSVLELELESGGLA